MIQFAEAFDKILCKLSKFIKKCDFPIDVSDMRFH